MLPIDSQRSRAWCTLSAQVAQHRTRGTRSTHQQIHSINNTTGIHMNMNTSTNMSTDKGVTVQQRCTLVLNFGSPIPQSLDHAANALGSK